MLTPVEVNRRKWLDLIAYLAMDVVQISFVALLIVDALVQLETPIPTSLLSVGLFVGIVVAQMVMIYAVGIAIRSNKDMIRLYPPSEAAGNCLCRYGSDQIVGWVMDVAKTAHQRVDRIYLMISAVPNAFTFSLPGLGSTVVLQSNLLDLLKPNEIQAIIAHEVSHVRNRDSMTNILVRMPSYFIDVVYVYLYARLALAAADLLLVQFRVFEGAAMLGTLVLVWITSRALMFISNGFIQDSSRQAELLADYHAATTLGHESTINALIQLGQRIEAITALTEEVKWLMSLNPTRTRQATEQEMNKIIQSFPLDEIDEDNARIEAPKLYLVNQLKTLRDVYGVHLTDEQIDFMASPAADRLAETRQKATEGAPSTQGRTIDWRGADHDKDGRLSADELRILVAMLRNSPTKLLFDNEVGMNMLTLDHPDFRRRVLFLADAFKL